MNYEYQYLLNLIRGIQNNNQVISSNRAKSAEELINGNNSLTVNTINKHFMFQTNGITNPVSIDPINKKILNVSEINGVNIEDLLGGIIAGYGIKIMDQGEGIFEINVKENMFALVSALENYVTNTALTTKLTDYMLTSQAYTKEECDENFVLKTDVVSSGDNDNKIPTLSLVEDLLNNNTTWTYNAEEKTVQLSSKIHDEYNMQDVCTAVTSLSGGPAFKIRNYASSYNEVSFGINSRNFLIINKNNIIFDYDGIDDQTRITNPCNENGEKLLTEVDAYTKTESDQKYMPLDAKITVDLSNY